VYHHLVSKKHYH